MGHFSERFEAVIIHFCAHCRAILKTMFLPAPDFFLLPENHRTYSFFKSTPH